LPTVPSARRPSLRSRIRRRAGLLIGAVGLAAVLAGCSAPGQVKNYNDQVSLNFQDACKAANDAKLSDDQAAQICGCWYDQVKANISFDRFKKIDESIRDAIDKGEFNNENDFKRVAPELYDVVTNSSCVQQGPQAS
jgi:hypothetical protein